MKKTFSTLLAIVALAFTAPLFALDPHDAQSVTVREFSTITTTTPQTVDITSLTTHAVNSGTNSYIYTADLGYDVPSGGAVTFQLTQGTTPIATTLTKVSTTGHVVLTAEVESVATSTVVKLQAVAKYATTPIKVGKATLTIVGLAGATQ